MKYDEKWVWGTSRFYPHEMANMIQVVLVSLAVLLFISIFCPGIFIPREEPADPMNTPEHIKPEWYLIGSYQVLKEFKTISIGDPAKRVEISGEVQGIAFLVLVLLAMLSVPFWERDKQPPSTPKKPNKIALVIALFGIIFLIMGIISNLYHHHTGVQGIILHILAILGLATMPWWGGTVGRSVWRKKPLFWGTMIAVIGFIYVTIKGLLA